MVDRWKLVICRINLTNTQNIKKMNIKQTIIKATVVLTAVAMIAPVSVGAVTIEELQAQINALLAQLSALQTSSTTTTGSTPAACVGVSFTRNLTVGST